MSESRPERNIYVYSNGTKDVHADPAVLWRNINVACKAAGETWEGVCARWTDLAGSPPDLDPADPSAAAAIAARRVAFLEFQGDLTAIVREAFKLAPLDDDGQGMTEAEVMGVLTGFIDWREKKDESTGTSPSSSASTDGATAGCSTGSTDPSPTTTSTG